jgi:hypothetical protein
MYINKICTDGCCVASQVLENAFEVLDFAITKVRDVNFAGRFSSYSP